MRKLGGIDDPPVLINILQYIHPNLHCLISRQLQTYAHGKLHHNLQTSIQHQLQPLPVSLLISLNSIETLKSFKVVLQGHKFNYESFSRVVVSRGNFETIQWFYLNGWNSINPTSFENGFDMKILPIIARRGDANLFMKFIERYLENQDFREYEEDLKSSLTEAAKYGNLKILQEAFSKNVRLVYNREYFSTVYNLEDQAEDLLASAAIGGHVNVLEWIWSNLSNDRKREFLYTWNWELISEVIKANQIKSLEWIYSNFQLEPVDDNNEIEEEEFDDVMILAAKCGNIDIVKWLSSKNIIDRRYSCTEAAAKGGNLEVLKHVREQGSQWSKKVCILAAKNGHLDMIQWARLQKCPWNPSKMFPAAVSCRTNQQPLDLYEWLWQQGCPFDAEDNFSIASTYGNYQFFLFAESKNPKVRLIYSTIDNLTNMGECASETGCLETIEWTLNKVNLFGPNPHFIKEKMIVSAACYENCNILDYLLEKFADKFWMWSPGSNGESEVDKLVESAAKRGRVDVLDWIVQRRTDWKEATVFNTALKCREIKVLIWLKSQKTAICTTNFWFGSSTSHRIKIGDYEIFHWFKRNGCPIDRFIYFREKVFGFHQE